MKTKLIRNDEAVRKAVIQSLTVNLLPSKLVRHDTLEGRDFLVVPMVILTEGVHVGSDGPLYYPKEELSKTPVVWNQKPIVVYHPEMNGVGISACDPVIINSRKIGVMMNTKFEKGKLKSEAWIEPTRANAVDTRIMAAVEAKEMMELSTGVFVDVEPVDEGEWKGETFVGVARNFRPDHLALLPDQIGACSIKDGAGFLRNADGANKIAIEAAFQKALRDVRLTENELSHSNIRDALSMALRKKFNIDNMKGPFLFIEAVYNDFVIYELDQKLYRIGYTASDTGVTLSTDTPVQVIRVTEFRTMTGTFVGNQEQKTNNAMDKKQIVDALIKNSNGLLVEADRERLMAFSESQLGKISFAKEEPKAPTGNEAPKTEPVPAAAPKTEQPPTANVAKPEAKEEPKPVTMAEYIAQAPREIQDVLNNSLAIHNDEKGRLIVAITANKQNAFTKEELEKRGLPELRNLAKLAGAFTPRMVNYEGQGHVPTENQEGEEPLEMPVMNFGKQAAAK